MTLASVLRRGRVEAPLVLRTPLSIHDISSNLHRIAHDWHESGMPMPLWEIGITELVVKGDGNQLTLEWNGQTNPATNPACFLTLVRLPTGGCEVTVQFGRGTLQVFSLLLLLTTPLQIVGDHGPMRWLFAAAQLGISLAFLITGRSKTPLLKQHLLEVVERATRTGSAQSPDGTLSAADTVPRLTP